MDRTVAIPIETKSRELDGKIWLAHHLVRQGFRVVLGQESEVMKSLDVISPDVLLSVSAGGTLAKAKLLASLREQGVTICVLDVEGGIFRTDEGYSVRLGPEILENVDYYFAWGNGPAELVSELAGFPENRVVVTGDPKFDLLSPAYRNYYQEDANRLKREFGDYVLVNTNFGMANHFDQKIKENLMTSEYVSRLRKPDEEFGFVEFQKKLLNEFIRSVKNLSASYKKVNFVVRPHPSENVHTYEKALEGYENVFARQEGDVHGWVSGAKCIIHNNCTTAIEAVLMGTTAIAYCPIRMEGYDLILPNPISMEASSQEELDSLVWRSISGDFGVESGVESLEQNKRKLLERYFNNTKGDGAQRISSALSEMFVSDRSKRKEDPVKMEVDWIVKVRRFGNKSLGITATETLERSAKILVGRHKALKYGEQKFSALASSEIRRKIEDMSEVVGGMAKDEITIRKVESLRNAFWLEPRKK